METPSEGGRNTGSLTAFVGPMFASKTTSLLKAHEREANAVLLKVDFDDRYANDKVVTHDGVGFAAHSIGAWDASLEDQYECFFFDEIQFFFRPYFDGDIVTIITGLLSKGRNVWIAGLDMDFMGHPFPFSPLLAMADTVYKLKSRCAVCGCPAGRTFKLGGGGGSVELGASDKYEARCNTHWVRRT